MIDISGHLRNYKQECGYLDEQNYITVNCCGYQQFITKNFTRHREKGRVDYQIIYVAKGRGHFKLGNVFVPIEEGNIVFYRPDETQHYTYFFKDSPEVYWIHFTGYGAEECMKKAGFLEKQTCFIGLSNSCIDLYKKIMYELQVKRPLHDQIATASFLELLVTMSRRYTEASNGVNKIKDVNLLRVIENMHSSYHLKWTVKDFARECNLSVYRFIHVFKTHTGMSPIEYLTKVRLDKAKELLLDSSLNISEISDVIGYESPLYFSRIFRKVTGTPPSEYRKRNESSGTVLVDS